MKGNRWCCTVIYNEYDGRYRAILQVEGKRIEEVNEYLPYLALRKRIRALTGIEILKRTDMKFERLSDFEKIARIDATQPREDCRVTLKEVWSGWQPDFSE